MPLLPMDVSMAQLLKDAPEVPDDWVPIDLTKYWPIHTYQAKPSQRLLRPVSVSSKKNDEGYYELTIIDRSHVVKISIPDYYRNGLGALASKIGWLQRACQHKPENVFLSKTVVNRLANIHDGFRRNLEFSFIVLRAFVKDSKSDSLDFSATLDSWLYTEYFTVSHHPPTYKAYNEMTVAELHPINISASDWDEWAIKFTGEWIEIEKGLVLGGTHNICTDAMAQHFNNQLAKPTTKPLSKKMVNLVYKELHDIKHEQGGDMSEGDDTENGEDEEEEGDLKGEPETRAAQKGRGRTRGKGKRHPGGGDHSKQERQKSSGGNGNGNGEEAQDREQEDNHKDVEDVDIDEKDDENEQDGEVDKVDGDHEDHEDNEDGKDDKDGKDDEDGEGEDDEGEGDEDGEGDDDDDEGGEDGKDGKDGNDDEDGKDDEDGEDNEDGEDGEDDKDDKDDKDDELPDSQKRKRLLPPVPEDKDAEGETDPDISQHPVQPTTKSQVAPTMSKAAPTKSKAGTTKSAANFAKSTAPTRSSERSKRAPSRGSTGDIFDVGDNKGPEDLAEALSTSFHIPKQNTTTTPLPETQVDTRYPKRQKKAKTTPLPSQQPTRITTPAPELEITSPAVAARTEKEARDNVRAWLAVNNTSGAGGS